MNQKITIGTLSVFHFVGGHQCRGCKPGRVQPPRCFLNDAGTKSRTPCIRAPWSRPPSIYRWYKVDGRPAIGQFFIYYTVGKYEERYVCFSAVCTHCCWYVHTIIYRVFSVFGRRKNCPGIGFHKKLYKQR